MHYPSTGLLGMVSSIFSFRICTIPKVKKEEGEMNRDDKGTSGE